MISEGSPGGSRSLLWWKGFVKHVGFSLKRKIENAESDNDDKNDFS